MKGAFRYLSLEFTNDPQKYDSVHLIPQRHPVHLLAQCSPIIRLQLSILDALLAPVLMHFADLIL